MVRHIRGLEDHETQERKRLHRDVRSPSQRLADALKLGQVQTLSLIHISEPTRH